MNTKQIMFGAFVLSISLLATPSMGPSGKYKAVGQGGPLAQKLMNYTSEVVIESNEEGTTKNVKEVWQSGQGKEKEVHVIEYDVSLDPKTRLLKVTSKGTQIGKGYCHFLAKGNIWCQQKMFSGGAFVELSKFYDAEKDEIHRIGVSKAIGKDGNVEVKSFSDSLTKQ